MCGRFVSSTGPADLASHFGAETIVGDVPARWNVAPTARVWVVHDADSRRTLETMRWGLVPSWADGPAVGNRMFNARAETVTTKPAYRAAARRRRCIVPADGFYEWTAVAGHSRKQAWYFHHADGSPLAMAGLWEIWGASPDEHDALRTCTVVTTNADAVVAPVHDRMPLILSDDLINGWLDPSATNPDEVSAMLARSEPHQLVAHAVGSAVNNARNDGPELVRPLDNAAGDTAGGSGPDDRPRLW